MNNVRRKELNKAARLLEEAQEILVNCCEEERDYYDNMPENLQNSGRGDRTGEVVDNLDEISNEVMNFITTIADIVE